MEIALHEPLKLDVILLNVLLEAACEEWKSVNLGFTYCAGRLHGASRSLPQ